MLNGDRAPAASSLAEWPVFDIWSCLSDHVFIRRRSHRASMEISGASSAITLAPVRVQSQTDGFGSSLKVTALASLACFVGAAILVFLYKTCLADCITQWRLGSYSSSTFTGFGGGSQLPTHTVRCGSSVTEAPVANRASAPPVTAASVLAGVGC
ncbi:movement protein [Bothriochloa barbinodis associated virus]|nr:movement protein [Bothriochloa barbinodis associated virus]